MKVFDLLVWSVVAIALILVVINYFGSLNTDKPIEEKINNYLELAQLPMNIGSTLFVGSLELKKEYILSRTYFDVVTKSLIIECTDETVCCPIGEICPKNIEWTNETLRVKNTFYSKLFVRCSKISDYTACRIYVGKPPAQAKVNEITILNQTSTSTTFKVKVLNDGENTLFFGKNDFELYSKIGTKIEKLDLNFLTQEINNLPIKATHEFIWTVDTIQPGEYVAKFTFQGENAGFDSNSIDFNTSFNTNCQINQNKIETKYITEEELINQGFYAKQYLYCSNCNAAWECLAVWKKSFPDINFNLENKEYVSCYTESPGINCINQ